nr:piggyBac transposable element-derived protein 1-like [Lepeophtheirus salmonis]
MNLVSKLPKVPDSNYHIVMDNFFTSPRLVRLLKENGIAATGTLRANRTENAPLIAIDEMKKGSRGIFDAVNDNKYNVTLVRWKDNKVVTVASTLYMVGVDGLDQNISNYMINLSDKKWWWALFRFGVDISINNAYQLYGLQPHNQGQKRLDLLGFRR